MLRIIRECVAGLAHVRTFVFAEHIEETVIAAFVGHFVSVNAQKSFLCGFDVFGFGPAVMCGVAFDKVLCKNIYQRSSFAVYIYFARSEVYLAGICGVYTAEVYNKLSVNVQPEVVITRKFKYYIVRLKTITL